MASLIARLGPHETRRVTLITRHHDKRWRIGWADRIKRPQRQRRLYSASFEHRHPFRGDPRVLENDNPLQKLAQLNVARKQSLPTAGAEPHQDAATSDEFPLTDRAREELSDEDRAGMQALLSSVSDGSLDEGELHGQTAFSWSLDKNSRRAWHIPAKIFDTLKNIPYRSLFERSLDRGQETMALKCWLAAAYRDDHDFFKSMTDKTFERLLEMMNPRALRLARFLEVHKQLSPYIARQLKLRPGEEIAGEYANVLHHIWSTRREYSTLTVEQYALFLRMARELGHKIFGETLFQALLEDGLTPDVECWNEYMGVFVHNRVHQAWARHHFRTIPYYMERRHNPSRVFQNYAVGPNGIKQTVTTMFQKMLRQGLSPNEKTFRFFIVAAAREGDMETVKSVLKKMWGIDAKAMAAGTSEEEIVTKEMTRQSPIYPSPELLTAIAHAFAINSDIPAGIEAVDLMARRFKVNVPHELWEELFERITPLVRSRPGSKNKINGTKVGSLDPKIVRRLFDTATGHPYYMEPTTRMYDVLLRSFSGVKADSASGHTASEPYTTGMEYVIVKGVFIYRKSLERFHQLRKILNSSKRRHDYDDVLAAFEQAALRSKRDHLSLRYWLRRLLSVTPNVLRARPWKVNRFYFRRIPQLLLLCEPWAPTKVWYEVPGGRVEFDIRTREDMLRSQTLAAHHYYATRKKQMRSERVVGRHWLYNQRANPITNLMKQAKRTGFAALPHEEFEVGRPPAA